MKHIMVPCAHCGILKNGRKAGLCWACYNTPEIRGLYPHLYSRCLSTKAPPDPTQPTRAQPGTEAKIRVMEERHRLGLSLFHQDDAELED